MPFSYLPIRPLWICGTLHEICTVNSCTLLRCHPGTLCICRSCATPHPQKKGGGAGGRRWSLASALTFPSMIHRHPQALGQYSLSHLLGFVWHRKKTQSVSYFSAMLAPPRPSHKRQSNVAPCCSMLPLTALGERPGSKSLHQIASKRSEGWATPSSVELT